MNIDGQAAGSWDCDNQQDGNCNGANQEGITTGEGGSFTPVDSGARLAAEMKVFDQVAKELRECLDENASFEERVSGIMKAAVDLFGVAPTWTAFYREVLGAKGVIRQGICAGDEMLAFECSSEHKELLKMLTTLRSRDDLLENDPFEAQRMITVRIPKSLHDAICDEAEACGISVNRLCISRLLQPVDRTLVPTSGQKRRGRRPRNQVRTENPSVPQSASE